jgi:hypothetical protein
LKKPVLKVIEGGRSALEREALRAIFFDVPKFHEIHQRLKATPGKPLRLVQGTVPRLSQL